MELRRSKRSRGNNSLCEDMLHILHSGRNQDGFELKFIDENIGHGVFTTRSFNKGNFLVEYMGELISFQEGRKRENTLSLNKGSFLFFFSHNGKRLCVDATEDPFDLNIGRMVNDCHIAPNSVVKVVLFCGEPRLCLFAKKDIQCQEELRYDYGVTDLPWRLHYQQNSGHKTTRNDMSLDDLTFCGLHKKSSHKLNKRHEKETFRANTEPLLGPTLSSNDRPPSTKSSLDPKLVAITKSLPYNNKPSATDSPSSTETLSPHESIETLSKTECSSNIELSSNIEQPRNTHCLLTTEPPLSHPSDKPPSTKSLLDHKSLAVMKYLPDTIVPFASGFPSVTEPASAQERGDTLSTTKCSSNFKLPSNIELPSNTNCPLTTELFLSPRLYSNDTPSPTKLPLDLKSVAVTKYLPNTNVPAVTGSPFATEPPSADGRTYSPLTTDCSLNFELPTNIETPCNTNCPPTTELPLSQRLYSGDKPSSTKSKFDINSVAGTNHLPYNIVPALISTASTTECSPNFEIPSNIKPPSHTNCLLTTEPSLSHRLSKSDRPLSTKLPLDLKPVAITESLSYTIVHAATSCQFATETPSDITDNLSTTICSSNLELPSNNEQPCNTNCSLTTKPLLSQPSDKPPSTKLLLDHKPMAVVKYLSDTIVPFARGFPSVTEPPSVQERGDTLSTINLSSNFKLPSNIQQPNNTNCPVTTQLPLSPRLYLNDKPSSTKSLLYRKPVAVTKSLPNTNVPAVTGSPFATEPPSADERAYIPTNIEPPCNTNCPLTTEPLLNQRLNSSDKSSSAKSLIDIKPMAVIKYLPHTIVHAANGTPSVTNSPSAHERTDTLLTIECSSNFEHPSNIEPPSNTNCPQTLWSLPLMPRLSSSHKPSSIKSQLYPIPVAAAKSLSSTILPVATYSPVSIEPPSTHDHESVETTSTTECSPSFELPSNIEPQCNTVCQLTTEPPSSPKLSSGDTRSSTKPLSDYKSVAVTTKLPYIIVPASIDSPFATEAASAGGRTDTPATIECSSNFELNVEPPCNTNCPVTTETPSSLRLLSSNTPSPTISLLYHKPETVTKCLPYTIVPDVTGSPFVTEHPSAHVGTYTPSTTGRSSSFESKVQPVFPTILPTELDLDRFECVDDLQKIALKNLKSNPFMSSAESDSDAIVNEDSDTEYIPSDNATHVSDSDCSDEYPMYGFPALLKTESKSVQESTVSSTISGGHCSAGSNSAVQVTSTSDAQRCKQFFCPYCEKPQAKLPRHLLTMHTDEDDVKKYELSSDKTEKLKMLTKLRNLGNHRHNVDVLRKQKGVLVVVYRQDSCVQPENYVPCPYCLGYYVSWELWRHAKRCCCAPGDRIKHMRILDGSRMLLPNTLNTSEGFRSVLCHMKSDQIGLVVKNDRLIMQLGEKLFMKNGHDRENFNSIRNTIREAGRLLINLREKVGPVDAGLEHFIDPLRFEEVICSARSVAGFSEDTHQFATPSLALKLGHTLKKCARIIEGNALQIGDDDKVNKAVRFNKLCELSWTEEVSTHALRTLSEQQRNKVKLIPLVKDVTLLTNYLKTTGNAAFMKLSTNGDDLDSWVKLNETALIQVIQFNRRRQGEVSKSKVYDYFNQHSTEQEDINTVLSPLEQKLCQSFKRIEIIGKRGRTVPMIITPEVKRWIDLLMATREAIGVNKENHFLFPRCHYGSLGHIRGCDVLRDVSEACGAKYPQLLRSTKLRKQIATLSQVLNLKENELDILANYLGHDIRVHRNFYRLPEETIQVAKISKLLIAMENGQFPQQQGKSLDEITVDEDEELDVVMADCPESEDDSEEDVYDIVPKPKKTKRRKKKTDQDSSSDDDKDEILTTGQPVKKRPWSDAEKAAVLRHFENHIFLDKIPKKKEADSCLFKERCLRKRTWRNIKDFVRNKIRYKKSRIN